MPTISPSVSPTVSLASSPTSSVSDFTKLPDTFVTLSLDSPTSVQQVSDKSVCTTVKPRKHQRNHSASRMQLTSITKDLKDVLGTALSSHFITQDQTYDTTPSPRPSPQHPAIPKIDLAPVRDAVAAPRRLECHHSQLSASIRNVAAAKEANPELTTVMTPEYSVPPCSTTTSTTADETRAGRDSVVTGHKPRVQRVPSFERLRSSVKRLAGRGSNQPSSHETYPAAPLAESDQLLASCRQPPAVIKGIPPVVIKEDMPHNTAPVPPDACSLAAPVQHTRLFVSWDRPNAPAPNAPLFVSWAEPSWAADGSELRVDENVLTTYTPSEANTTPRAWQQVNGRWIPASDPGAPSGAVSAPIRMERDVQQTRLFVSWDQPNAPAPNEPLFSSWVKPSWASNAIEPSFDQKKRFIEARSTSVCRVPCPAHASFNPSCESQVWATAPPREAGAEGAGAEQDNPCVIL